MRNLVKSSILVILLGFSCSSLICFAQNISINDYKNEGVLVSEGSNTSPVGKLKVMSYRLEVIKLAKPFVLKSSELPIETAFRLVIKTKKKLPLEVFSVLLNEAELDAVQIKPDAVAVIIYARTLPNGIQLALSKKGEKESPYLSVLPELLEVPSEYATPEREIEANKPIIKLKRLSGRYPIIEIRIEIPGKKCALTNNPTVIEIDGEDLNTFCDGDEIFVRLSNEEFTRLRQGAEIFLKRGLVSKTRNRFRAGYLNKDSLP